MNLNHQSGYNNRPVTEIAQFFSDIDLEVTSETLKNRKPLYPNNANDILSFFYIQWTI